jgi:transcriptional regulator with XRE-family HTH domain
MPTTGNKVRAIRKARLLKQQSLAESAALSVQALRAIEAGRTSTPRHETIVRLAEALCVHPLDLANPSLSAQACLRKAEQTGLIYVPKPEPERTSQPEKGGADRINLRSSNHAGADS